ncbi:Gfo/Idh/MocA family protein [Halomicrobium urmianum]|uniref:Gfo/Idh/MocA family protein n=1 Tax=Halomicrobium urmianum TaxID=1586233 RepID=UPI001CD97DE8|nr:Gfo/Idh/MocA family oxidoreductase [Halomicrobium urmianum]
MTAIEDLRLGFIGLGNIAHFHADAVREVGAIVAAGTDIEEAARRTFAEEYGAETFADPQKMFETVDAVIVSTPNRFHEEYVVASLEAGVDVLVEKPLAHTLESAERVVETAEESDAFCMVGFHNRFRDPVKVLNQYRLDGDMGEVNHIEANYVRRRGVPGRGSWFTRKEVSGGGSVIDIGTHALDLGLHLMGFPEVHEVSAQTRSQFGTEEDYTYIDMWGEDQGSGAFDVDDSATAFVRCEGGKTLSLEVAWATNRHPTQEIVIRGTGAGAHLDMATDSLEVLETTPQGASHHRDIEIETAGDEPHAVEEEYFLEHVARDEHPEMNTVEEAFVVQKIMDAIYRSSERGEAVTVR